MINKISQNVIPPNGPPSRRGLRNSEKFQQNRHSLNNTIKYDSIKLKNK